MTKTYQDITGVTAINLGSAVNDAKVVITMNIAAESESKRRDLIRMALDQLTVAASFPMAAGKATRFSAQIGDAGLNKLDGEMLSGSFQ